jgi:hypothetical protein
MTQFLAQPQDEEGRVYVVAASRPLTCTTYFTMAGDSSTVIGDGKELKWDFSNSTDDITPPTGFKRKRIVFDFKDPVYIKEGTVYWKDAPFGSYIDIYIVNKSPETKVSHYVNKHFVMDTCVIGDELNTEQASSQLPTTLEFWLEITTPDETGYTDFKGYAELELYRENTV